MSDRKEYLRQYYLKNKAKIDVYKKQYKIDHRDRINENWRRRYYLKKPHYRENIFLKAQPYLPREVIHILETVKVIFVKKQDIVIHAKDLIKCDHVILIFNHDVINSLFVGVAKIYLKQFTYKGVNEEEFIKDNVEKWTKEYNFKLENVKNVD
jgi:hypothetical protein